MSYRVERLPNGVLAITTMSLLSGFFQSSQSLLRRVSSSNYFLVGFFVVLALLVSLLTLYSQSGRELSFDGANKVFNGRDFSRTPFSLMDAYDACVLESKQKLGATLLRNHMLPLSTRYDKDKGEYLVVINADVGTPEQWNEATIYCSINPVKEEVSYYKEVHEGKHSILAKTMDILNSALR